MTDLTAREVEVLRLVAQGLSDAQIAGRLFLSPHTVHRHVANVRTKLALPSRAAAVGARRARWACSSRWPVRPSAGWPDRRSDRRPGAVASAA